MQSRNRVLNPDMPGSYPGMYFSGNHIIETPVSAPVKAGKLIPALMEFLDSGGVDRNVMRRADIFINGRLIPRSEWLDAFVIEGDRVQVCARIKGGGGGGKNVMQMIATVLVVAAAALATAYVGGVGGWMGMGGFGLGLGSAWGAAAGTAVMLGGSLLTGALFKAKTPSLGGLEQSGQNYVMQSTGNASRLYEAQEILIGRTLVSPSYAAAYFSTFEGDTQYWHGLYQVSTGDVHVEPGSIRISDTPLSNYSNAQFWVHEGWTGGKLNYFNFKRREIQENVTLEYGAPHTFRRTDAGVRRIVLMIQYPTGLFWSRKSGGTEDVTSSILYRWRRAGGTSWSASAECVIEENKTSAFIRTITIVTPAADPADTAYEYEVWRKDNSSARYESYIGRPTFVGAQYWYDEPAVQYRAPFSKTLIEIRVKADGQLSGAVSTLNCVAQSYGLVPNADGGFDRALTTNPAALAAAFMVDGTRTARPYPKERIDWRTVRDHYNFCKKYGFEYSALRTDGAKSGAVAADILAAGLGWLVPGDKFRFAFDAVSGEYTDIATPWTCWGFELHKEYPVYPVHGLRVEFPNREKDWQLDETVVYADGYDNNNAVNVVAWSPAEGNRGTTGVDNYECVYKLARIKLAQIAQRPETVRFSTNWRSLDYHVGQNIAVAYDVYLVGSGGGRVCAYVGESGEPLRTDDPATLCAGILIDSSVAMTAGKTYVVRDGEKGSQKTWTLKTVAGAHNALFFQFPVPVSAAPKLMTAASVGESSRDVMVCTITDIRRNENFTAAITAVPAKAAEILAAMTGKIPAFDSLITTDSHYQAGRPNPPVITQIRSDESALRKLLGALIPRIGICFVLPQPNGVTADTVYAQYRARGTASWTDGGSVDARAGEIFIEGVVEGAAYEVRLAAGFAGIRSNWTASFTHTVIGRTTPPPPPVKVRLNGNLLYWEMDDDAPIDIAGWEVWMTMDDTDAFSAARNISRGVLTERAFDLSPWAGHSRRAWVRTVDDLGLTSTPVSVGVNLGDVLVNNVVVSVLEKADRGWPGTLTNGSVLAGRLVPDSESGFWEDGSGFWAEGDFWGGGAARAMEYVTGMKIPQDVAGCGFSILLTAPGGGVASVEYRFATSGPVWDGDDFWGNENFWNVSLEAEWEPMPDKLTIGGGEYVQIRVRTAGASGAAVNEIEWVFDVEDETDFADDLAVPAAGMRVPLTKTFRWIKNISFGQEYHEGSGAVRTVYVDKGVIANGRVLAGPQIYCRDANNMNVSGIVDVTMQGAKGD